MNMAVSLKILVATIVTFAVRETVSEVKAQTVLATTESEQLLKYSKQNKIKQQQQQQRVQKS